MPDVTAVPSKAAWATPVTSRTLVSGAITVQPTPSKAAWATPAARVVLQLGRPSVAQAKTLSAGMTLRTAPLPSLAAWRTPQGSLTVAGQGRILRSLTEALARIAAGLPVAYTTILPDEYTGRLP